ncbi:MAG: ankyrin repeat domain-containing protein [Chitinophagaceae bacterium]|nr:MAG: ankyrin repeat domain-containing protein [Chitinophagaceae bacterium]
MYFKLVILLAACVSGSIRMDAQQSAMSLLESIRSGDTMLVKKILAGHPDLNVTDSDGDGVLKYAALYSHPAMMTILVDAGADVNQLNGMKETALMWSMPDTLKAALLLSRGAAVNSISSEGNSALLIACVGSNQSAIIRLLLGVGADAGAVNAKGATALIRLAGYGDTTSANLLVNAGCNLHEKMRDSLNALFPAVKSGNLPMVKWLLDKGIDANAPDLYKVTPISYVTTSDNLELVKLLLDRTVDINRPDIDGFTPLMWAVYNEHDNPDIVQAFIDRGADPKFVASNGESVLDWARKKGETKTVSLLKKYTPR